MFNQECSNCNSLLRRNIINIEDTYVDKLVSHPALLSGNKESRKQHYFLEMKQQFFQECSNHKGSFFNNGIMHIKHLSAGTMNIIHVRFIDYTSSTKLTTIYTNVMANCLVRVITEDVSNLPNLKGPASSSSKIYIIGSNERIRE